MPLDLAAGSLLVEPLVSKFIFGVDDVTLTPQLSAQQRIAFELACDTASEQVKKFCDFSIVEGTYTEVWDGAAADELIPRETPITSVTSVKFSGSGDFSDSQALPANTVVIGSNGQVINLRGNVLTPRGRGMVEIVYVAGYASVPKMIQLATLRQIQYLYKQLGKGDAMTGLKTITKMNESQTKDDSLGRTGLLTEVEGMLKSFARFDAPNSIMFTRVT